MKTKKEERRPIRHTNGQDARNEYEDRACGTESDGEDHPVQSADRQGRGVSGGKGRGE